MHKASGHADYFHRHGETEVFLILEGRYLFDVGRRRFEAGAGWTGGPDTGALEVSMRVSAFSDASGGKRTASSSPGAGIANVGDPQSIAGKN